MTLRESLGMEPIYHESDNAYTPSKAVTGMMAAKKIWYTPQELDKKAPAGKKVLVLAVDQLYIDCQNGKRYRAGNHPVELFTVAKHLNDAGYEIVYSTLTGKSIMLEDFAMPTEDPVLMDFIESEKIKWENPQVIADIVSGLDANSPYDAVFLPGGQGAILGLPESKDTKAALQWFIKNDKYIVGICHGPASLLSLSIDEAPENFPFKDYKLSCFPTAGDKGATMIGYLPGEMPWYFDEKLKQLGMDNVSPLGLGITHVDRKLITGDNPFVADKLGKLAASILVNGVPPNA